MVPFARAELEQISRKMACNEYFGASLDHKIVVNDDVDKYMQPARSQNSRK